MLEVVDKTIIFVSLSIFIGFISLLLAILALHKIRVISNKSELLFSGKSGESLEGVISKHSQSILQLDKEIQELFEISNKVHNLSLKGLHKVGVIRFNPFKDIGGNQSFAIAILDGKNSGLVLSSLHTREGTRIYSKPIVKGLCEDYQLTEEEVKAIASAKLEKGTKV